MVRPTPRTTFRALLYGGAAALLTLDIIFLLRALIVSNLIPIIPIVAGIGVAGGLLMVVYAEHQAREEDRRDHRRISRVAHQLQMPLKKLQEDFKQLSARADALPAEARLTIKRMETKTQTLLENIRDVFLMLQAQEDSISKDRRRYDACTLVKEVITRMKPLAAAHNVELIYQLHCQDAFLRVDKQLFLIVLTHLIENGILYTLKPGWVNVAIVRGASKVRIIVQDRGIGVGAAERKTVWQPFARGESAERYDPDGIGVGLTLSRLIVREWGGELIYRDRPASLGTQFEIHLPLAKLSKNE